MLNARFWDKGQYPPKEMPPTGAVKWAMNPGLVNWGEGYDPNWAKIAITGKTPGIGKTIATDPGTGIQTEEIDVQVTSEPRADTMTDGTLVLEDVPPTTLAQQTFPPPDAVGEPEPEGALPLDWDEA